jgi:hypothetical protein
MQCRTSRYSNDIPNLGHDGKVGSVGEGMSDSNFGRIQAREEVVSLISRAGCCLKIAARVLCMNVSAAEVVLQN